MGKSFCIFLWRRLLPEREAAPQAKRDPRSSVSDKEKLHAAETSYIPTMIV